MRVRKCVSEKHSLSLTGPQWFSPSLKVREVWFNDLGTTRTSEPESLNIGTPFQMTLEAVGHSSDKTPSAQLPLRRSLASGDRASPATHL